MKIFSKNALKFDHPKGQEEPVRVSAGNFHEVPEWVKQSTMFLLALKSEIVSVIEGKSDEKKVEKAATEKKIAPKTEEK